MYEELVRSLRQCADASCAGCKNDLVEIGCRGKLQREAADAIEELKKKLYFQDITTAQILDMYIPFFIPKWIPVTKMLPDNIDEEVLVCNEGYGKDGTGFATVAVYNGNGWLECWERKQYLDCITYWMPLPEPPKEDT